MIEILKAIVYGIVEGISEWLPISSTGHLILLEELMPFEFYSEGRIDVQTGVMLSPAEWAAAYFSMFEVVIQLGAILAVVVLFWNQIFPFHFGKAAKEKNGFIDMKIMTLWFKIIVACLPAVLLVVLGLDEYFEEIFYRYEVVALALIVFGIAFIVIENWNKGRNQKIAELAQLTYKAAFIIGLFQLLAAIFPGTSRSGATIIGALLIGVSRTVAAEFTFFLAIPVMFGASLLKLLKFGFNFTSLELSVLIVGMVVAFVISLLVIKFLMGYIKKHDFKVFGWYRIVLGIVVLVFFGILA